MRRSSRLHDHSCSVNSYKFRGETRKLCFHLMRLPNHKHHVVQMINFWSSDSQTSTSSFDQRRWVDDAIRNGSSLLLNELFLPKLLCLKPGPCRKNSLTSTKRKVMMGLMTLLMPKTFRRLEPVFRFRFCLLSHSNNVENYHATSILLKYC